MTSSENTLSDSSGPDKQQQQSQLEVQNPNPADENFQPGMPAPPPMHMMPRGQPEEGQTGMWYSFDAHLDIGPYYGNSIAAYGGLAVMHPYMMGVIQLGVPLPTDAIEEPVYVNAKQYHGILGRQQSLEKLNLKIN